MRLSNHFILIAVALRRATSPGIPVFSWLRRLFWLQLSQVFHGEVDGTWPVQGIIFPSDLRVIQ
jgi:hypothetical protein